MKPTEKQPPSVAKSGMLLLVWERGIPSLTSARAARRALLLAALLAASCGGIVSRSESNSEIPSGSAGQGAVTTPCASACPEFPACGPSSTWTQLPGECCPRCVPLTGSAGTGSGSGGSSASKAGGSNAGDGGASVGGAEASGGGASGMAGANTGEGGAGTAGASAGAAGSSAGASGSSAGASGSVSACTLLRLRQTVRARQLAIFKARGDNACQLDSDCSLIKDDSSCGCSELALSQHEAASVHALSCQQCPSREPPCAASSIAVCSGGICRTAPN